MHWNPAGVLCWRGSALALVMCVEACAVRPAERPEAPPSPEPPARPSPAAENAGASSLSAVSHGEGELPGTLAPGALAAARVYESHPYHQPMPPVAGRDASTASAMDHANLSPAACRARLSKRQLPVKAAGGARGVANPRRLTGPMHGVTFRGPGMKSIHSIMDCRLVLALEAFAEVLARHGVIEVLYGNSYRRGAHLPGQRRKRSQHAYGLAIDIVWFKLRDKTILRVQEDYHGELGKPSCGPSAWLAPPTEKAVTLRNIVCDVARAGVFHHMLTPNYDAAHASHFHFDIKRGGKWIAIR